MLTLAPGPPTTHEIEIQRSRFLAAVARTDGEPAARAFVERVRRDSPGARHHCSAFLVSTPDGRPVERSSDDGEPAGTAGTPMLDVLRASGLVDVTAVVTRWFGGILLGTGGLVRAYSSALAGALERAPRVRALDLPVVEARLSPADAGRVEAELRAGGARLLEARWSADVLLRVAPAQEDADGAAAAALLARIAELTGGRARVRPAGRTRLEVDASAPAP